MLNLLVVNIFGLHFLFANTASAETHAYPTAASQCTRGSNPLQEAKDSLVNIEMNLAATAEKMESNQFKIAQSKTIEVRRLLGIAKTYAEKQSRILPGALERDLNSFFQDMQKQQLNAKALAKQARRLSQGAGEIAATFGCPKVLEPVFVGLLPPDLSKKELRKRRDSPYPRYTFKTYALSLANTKQLVHESVDIPIGDCPHCKRGISLGCKPFKSKSTPTEPQKTACDEGLAGGIGIRISAKTEATELSIKNETHYSVTVPGTKKSDGSYILPADDTHLIILSRPSLDDPKKWTDIYQIELNTF